MGGGAANGILALVSCGRAKGDAAPILFAPVYIRQNDQRRARKPSTAGRFRDEFLR
jgi:hypothetical protein